MSNLFSLVRRAPKRFIAAALILAAVIAIPAMSNAWGPNRQTFTIEHPADHVAFDSITDNPNIGDERNFVGIREVGSDNVWYDSMKVQSDKSYYVRLYVHNNAAANLNLVAHDVTAKVNLPTTTAKSIEVNGFLSASNIGANNSGNAGQYGEIYDNATFTSDKNFNLAYVPGSLKYENNIFGPSGTSLSESIFTSKGVKLGYDKLDGNIPGCFQYAGYITFEVKPQVQKTTDFTFSKQVSKHGANNWQNSYTAQPGETVDFALVYKNTGEVQQDDVTFRDSLPKGLSYVANSGAWSNVNTQNVKFTHDANLTNGTGINVGSYLPGGNAYVIFSAKVASVDQLECGVNSLTNTAKVNTGGYSVSDSATVTVNKECKPVVVTPVHTCDLLTATKLERNQFQFTAKATAKDGATIKNYSFDFGDGQNATQNGNVIKHTYTKDGTFTIKVTVNFTVDGKTVSDNGENCVTQVTVKPVTPGNIEVCDLNTKKIVTITEKDFDSSKYSKNLDDCKTTVELPHTGISENIFSILGVGSLVASTIYYLASRRN